MREFFETLLTEGHARLATAEAAASHEVEQAVSLILAHEVELRLTLAGEPPIPNAVAVRWGATMFSRAAQFLAYRELDRVQLERELSAPCPEAPCPEVCYGVDLAFRFLPDLVRLARAASADDPLVGRLMAWAGAWPLSSVSISGVAVGSLDGFIEHPTLRMLYVDRILAAKDLSRLDDERVREAARACLGAHTVLAPEVARELTVAKEG